MRTPLLIWFRHASFLYNGSKKIYIDPWDIDVTYGPADIICITHAHFDHFSPETIERLKAPHTKIVAPHDVAEKLGPSATPFKPGETLAIGKIQLTGVPAYNIDKPYHPKENEWLGYIISVDGETIYHAGDTDHIPEMKKIKTRIALLPVGGTYTMDAEEAAEAAKDISAKEYVPMHYGYAVGSQKDGRRFAERVGAKATVYIPVIPFEKE